MQCIWTRSLTIVIKNVFWYKFYKLDEIHTILNALFYFLFVEKKVDCFSANLKKKISEALLGMHKLPEWQPQLEEWNIERYTKIDDSLYDLETSLMDLCKGLSLSSVYY